MRIDPTILLKTMDDDHFSMSKSLFLKNQEVFAQTKDNKLVEYLTETLCKWNIIEQMDREEFGGLLLTYFYNELSDHGYVIRYMEGFKSLLTDNLSHYHTSDRAKQYTVYLDQMIAKEKELHKKKAEETVAAKEELVETLLDCLLISLRIYQAMQDSGKSKAPISNFKDHITPSTFELFSASHFKFGKDQKIVASDMHNEDKWFRWFLTQILMIRLLQDNEDFFEVTNETITTQIS